VWCSSFNILVIELFIFFLLWFINFTSHGFQVVSELSIFLGINEILFFFEIEIFLIKFR
jgi:hypothetical protein